jgi:hypothetical protein
LLLDRFPVAPPPRPGLAAGLPTVALGLHELGTIAESGPYPSDGGDAVVGEEAQEALLNLPREQRLVMPGEHDCGLLRHRTGTENAMRELWRAAVSRVRLPGLRRPG